MLLIDALFIVTILCTYLVIGFMVCFLGFLLLPEDVKLKILKYFRAID